MNKQQALLMLTKLFSLYDGTLQIHESIIVEVMAILKNSGVERKVFDLLATRLITLLKLREKACDAKEFEILGNGIYSMHIDSGNKNIRILYSFHGSDIYLLHAFFERGGKKNTDYTGRIELAKRRLIEME